MAPLLWSLVLNFLSGQSVAIFDLIGSRVQLDSVYFWVQTLQLSVDSSSEQSSDQTAQGFYLSIGQASKTLDVPMTRWGVLAILVDGGTGEHGARDSVTARLQV